MKDKINYQSIIIYPSSWPLEVWLKHIHNSYDETSITSSFFLFKLKDTSHNLLVVLALFKSHIHNWLLGVQIRLNYGSFSSAWRLWACFSFKTFKTYNFSGLSEKTVRTWIQSNLTILTNLLSIALKNSIGHPLRSDTTPLIKTPNEILEPYFGFYGVLWGLFSSSLSSLLVHPPSFLFFPFYVHNAQFSPNPSLSTHCLFIKFSSHMHINGISSLWKQLDFWISLLWTYNYFI